MLEVQNIHTYYGESYILQGLSLDIKEGEIVALIGRNGMGKTTTLRSIMGIQTPRRGKIIYKGEDITDLPTYKIAQKGIALVPEERRIIPGLTVYENLKIGMIRQGKIDNKKMSKSLEKIFYHFPGLKERLNQEGTSLSGGEQQMLTIARAMMSEPELLLIDEPTEGLMPILVKEIVKIIKELHEEGSTILVVEQNIEIALGISDKQRAYIIEKGKIKAQGLAKEIMANKEIINKYLGVNVG